MEIHNISEDIVILSTQRIFESIQKEGNPQGFCLCDQCMLDTVCYTLNRIEPQYIVSNRGITRLNQDWVGRQQIEADIASLVYNGIRLVNHNLRPTSSHNELSAADNRNQTKPAFYFPTILGRLFDGITFAPLSGVTVELRCDSELVTMRNRNWQNPFTLISNTPGSFSFWPAPVDASAVDINRVFEYSIKVEASQYETLTHFFKVPSVSILQSPHVEKTFKLPDLYLFPPGEENMNRNILDAEQNG